MYHIFQGNNTARAQYMIHNLLRFRLAFYRMNTALLNLGNLLY